MDRRTVLQRMFGGVVGLASTLGLTKLLASGGMVGETGPAILYQEQQIPLSVLKKMYPEWKGYEVQVLDHYANEYKYQSYKTFKTQAEAEAWVRSLMPKLIWVGIRKDRVDVEEIFVGLYAGADTTLEFSDLGLAKAGLFYSVADAWMFLANIRINGQPVARPVHSLSAYVIQPFSRGDPWVQELGTRNTAEVKEIVIHQIRTGYRNAVRAQFKL